MSENQFGVEYQPYVSLDTGKICGFEALLRWYHPTEGRISPNEFIPIAEDIGAIVPLGYWVLNTACHQLKVWQNLKPNASLSISVNLSGRQLFQPDLVEQISQTLQRVDLPANSLRLEITESVLIENFPEAAMRLKQLGDLGVELAIDDFGTGYSSLDRLRSFNVSVLKIDRVFIRQMGLLGERSEILRAIVALGHSLKMKINAEGIETAGQLANLRSMGCNEGQGFFFAHPLTADGVNSLLAAECQW